MARANIWTPHAYGTLLLGQQVTMTSSRITIAERIEAVKARGAHGDKDVCKKHRITLRTLQRWTVNLGVYLTTDKSKKSKMTLHNGRAREKINESAHLLAIVNSMISSGIGMLYN
jgi:hypothetical protein